MPKEELAKLTKLKNCVVYPPIAFLSDEARIAKQEIFINNMVDFLGGKSPRNRIN